MNRGDVVKKISGEEGIAATLVDRVLGSFFDTVTSGLAGGDDVTIRGFGKFEPRQRRAVVRRNPRTGVEISVPAKTSVGFKPSTNLKTRLNMNGRRRGGRTRS